MLSNAHFYHRIIRKNVVSFGSIFNNIRLVKYTKDGLTEIERITVPLVYADKEKYYKRISEDPNLTREVDISLPKISFDMTSIQFDPTRKTSLFNRQSNLVGSDTRKSVNAVPYNFNFTLSVYVRNTEDGAQIVEQILPYFNPDYTLNIDYVGIDNLKIDVPIILNDVIYNSNFEGMPEETRVQTWDLTFSMKGYLYGQVSDSSIIRKSTANTFYYNTSSGSSRVLTLDSGSVNYKVGELVYEGPSLQTSNAHGFVDSWNSTSNTLTIVDSSGVLREGFDLKGAITGAKWNIQSFRNNDYQLESLTVEPNPPDANSEDDFGFTETLTTYY